MPKMQILEFGKDFYTWHTFGGCLIRYINMDPTRTVGATERTTDVGQTHRRTDRRTDGKSETNIPPKTLLCVGYNYMLHTARQVLRTLVRNWSVIQERQSMVRSSPLLTHCIYVSPHGDAQNGFIYIYIYGHNIRNMNIIGTIGMC